MRPCRVVIVVACVLGEETDGGAADERARASEVALEGGSAGEEARERRRIVLSELHLPPSYDKSRGCASFT